MTSQKADRHASVCSSTHASFLIGSSAMTLTGGSRQAVHERQGDLTKAEAAACSWIVETFPPGLEQKLTHRRAILRRRQPIQLEQPVAAVRKEQCPIAFVPLRRQQGAIRPEQVQYVIGRHRKVTD